jgi:penicillin-binding protein 1B
VTVRRALEQSLNSATIRVAEHAGMANVVETARALGFAGTLSAVPAAALGAFEATPLELARAYLPLVNAGVRPAATPAVRAVHDRDGPLEEASLGEATAVLTPAEAYLVTSLLEGVIRSGTAVSARDLGVTGSVAGKAGTTNDGRDAWFVGYAPGLLTVVWVGYDSNDPHGLSGAQAALPIWAEFMRSAMQAYAPQGFTVPSGVLFSAIDLETGRLANRFCPIVVKEVFIAGTEPEPCAEHGGVGDRVQEWWHRFRDWLRR